MSIYLEEPTTCNYILTVEAAFLCPLLKTTDSLGMFSFPSKGIESLEKALKSPSGRDEGKEESQHSSERGDSVQDVSGKKDGTEWKKEKIMTGEDIRRNEEGQREGFGEYDDGKELDDEGNEKPTNEEKKESNEQSEKSEQDTQERT